MNKKLFAFDMDGTILNSKNSVQPKTIEALRKIKNKGHLTAIATGRPFDDSIRDLGKAIPLLDYIICNNGAYDYDSASKEFSRNGELPKEVIQKAIEVGKNFNCFFAIHGDRKAERSALSDNIDWEDVQFDEFRKFKNELKSEKEIVEWSDTQHVFQVSLRQTKEIIDEAAKEFDDITVCDVHIANDVYIDLNPVGISKLNGLKKVISRIGMNLEDVIAFGDSGNDLEMLKGVGFGIAMSNGNELAKKAANEIIGSNDTDAIAEKIEEFLR